MLNQQEAKVVWVIKNMNKLKLKLKRERLKNKMIIQSYQYSKTNNQMDKNIFIERMYVLTQKFNQA
jgi:hypothetical protein